MKRCPNCMSERQVIQTKAGDFYCATCHLRFISSEPNTASDYRRWLSKLDYRRLSYLTDKGLLMRLHKLGFTEATLLDIPRLRFVLSEPITA